MLYIPLTSRPRVQNSVSPHAQESEVHPPTCRNSDSHFLLQAPPTAIYTLDSISQHALGSMAPSPGMFWASDYISQHSVGPERLSPGKGPCSCCKFPRIFWLKRWIRRVTTCDVVSSPVRLEEQLCGCHFFLYQGAWVPVTWAPSQKPRPHVEASPPP